MKHVSISIANQIFLITFKMPKLKCGSSSFTTSGSRKRKKLRIPERMQQDSESDENYIRQETSGLRNTEAYQIACLDPLRRQQEQIRNTPVHR